MTDKFAYISPMIPLEMVQPVDPVSLKGQFQDRATEIMMKLRGRKP